MQAAFLIIGNEILSGRTVEKNLPVLAGILRQKGIAIKEVRVVRDEEPAIVEALAVLKKQYDYVFTSGGIGPTHDDITSATVAKTFNLPLVENTDAVRLLKEFYQTRAVEFTSARRRMALMPQGANIINSDFPGAPGFCIDNVFVLAGVPSIFKLMAVAVGKQLPQGDVPVTLSITLYAGETSFSDCLAQVAQQFSEVEIGSYPYSKGEKLMCNITLTGTAQATGAALQTLTPQLTALNIEFTVDTPTV